jgi:hypothetical protein
MAEKVLTSSMVVCCCAAAPFMSETTPNMTGIFWACKKNAMKFNGRMMALWGPGYPREQVGPFVPQCFKGASGLAFQ